jgi:hypothetical protein
MDLRSTGSTPTGVDDHATSRYDERLHLDSGRDEMAPSG